LQMAQVDGPVVDQVARNAGQKVLFSPSGGLGEGKSALGCGRVGPGHAHELVPRLGDRT